MRRIGLAVGLILAGVTAVTGQAWESAMVYKNPGTGRLVYAVDSAGNRIPDFSYAGYRNGGITPPIVPAIRTLGPMAGDNTVRIQAELDVLAALIPDANGMRGALLLTAGRYEVQGTLRITKGGIVLRGAGDDADPALNTVLVGVGDTPHQRTMILAGGGTSSRWKEQVSGTKTDIVSDTVFVGQRRFRVNNPAPFAAGDNVVLYHPCTDAWLAAIDYGGPHETEPGAEPGVDLPWAVNSQPIAYNRYITGISGDTVTIDAPVFTTFVRSLSQSYVYKFARTGIERNIGIEALRVEIASAGGEDENHAWNAIEMVQVEDCWIRHCTTLHFGHAGFITRTATRITIDSCQALEPVSIITGERRYNYDMSDASQLVLVTHCVASGGRHDFVSNGASYTSGCVFVDSRSVGTNASSEGHRRWSTGLLYDNITFASPNTTMVLGLYNRGHYGTSHGWALAHGVAWNCDAAGKDVIVQRPPTAQNYAIGCQGTVTGKQPPAPFNEPEGYVEGTNRQGLSPRSLYYAQLEERLGFPTTVQESARAVPAPRGELLPVYPNPVNGSAHITFVIPEAMHVRLGMYDLLGRELDRLIDESRGAGEHRVRWDAGNRASGMYLCRFETASAVRSFRVVLIR